MGTRVPVDALIDFLEGDDTIEDFLLERALEPARVRVG
jgi:uncharacterized protein (DUF433 family)